MFHFRHSSKVQMRTGFKKWNYARSVETRKICSVRRTVSVPLTPSGNYCSLRQASIPVIVPASYLSSEFGVCYAHNWKYTSVRRASSATSVRNADKYDYIIVGAGSAGCVLANRLTGSDRSTKVLLVEAGPPADRLWKVRMPAALMYCLKDPRYSWCYESVPQVHWHFAAIAGNVVVSCHCHYIHSDLHVIWNYGQDVPGKMLWICLLE